MSISSDATRKAGPSACNGATVNFPFTFKVFTTADVLVVLTDSTGVETTLTLTTNYTVTLNANQDANPGGTVTTNVAYATGNSITIGSQVRELQSVVLTNGGGFFPSVLNDALDRVTIICQQISEVVSRAVVVPFSSTTTAAQLIASLFAAETNAASSASAAASSATSAAGSATAAAGSASSASTSATNAGNSATAAAASATTASTAATTATTQASNASTSATNATASATAASGSATTASSAATTATTQASNASTSATNASNSATAAAASATTASTAATNASNSATAAAASATAAAATLASALWRDVVFVTSASSPVNIAQADNGKLYVADTTGGAITFNLPTIATLTLPYNMGIKLEAGSNAVTINRGGTDTIDGATSKTLSVVGGGTQLLADIDPVPDVWTAVDFGQSGGNYTDETFTAGVDFTAGVSTTLTLANSYGSKTNITVHFDAAFVGPAGYSLSGTTLTFTSAIPGTVSKVYIKGGASLPINTPGDGTVTSAKLSSSSLSDFTHAGTAKTSLADADEFGFWDSVSTLFRKITWANIVAAILARVNTWTAGQSGQYVTLTDQATLAIDLSLGNNFEVTLGGNRTVGVPTNPKKGQEFTITAYQDITGSRTLAWAWPWQIVGGTPIAISTAKLAKDVISALVDNYATGTVTISNATPAVVTWTGHGLRSGAIVQYTTTGALPTGLSTSTTYWVTVVDADTFKLSTSLANAQAATFVATSSAGSGVHTCTNYQITYNLGLGVA